MALSAALRRWMWGGANWKSTSLSIKNSFNIVEHSLSNVHSFGVSPAALNLAKQILYAANIEAASLFLIGSPSI